MNSPRKTFSTYEEARRECDKLVGWDCPAPKEWLDLEGKERWLVTALDPQTYRLVALCEDGRLENY